MPFLLAMAPQPGGDPGSANRSFLFMMVAMFAIMYFLMIRPQQRKEKERRAMLAQVKTGDRIVFGGGFIGVVANTAERKLTVKIADGVKVEILRGAVTNVLAPEDDLGNATP